MIAHHLGRDHGQRLALGRVHLARHDRRARLVGRQRQFADAAARARAQEADVVGDLHRCRRADIQCARCRDQCVMGCKARELVRHGLERLARDPGDFLGELLGEALGRVQAGADRGAALGELQQVRHGTLDPRDHAFHLRDIAGEFLTQRQRGRVLGVGTADLDDVVEFLRLGLQRILHVVQRRQQAVGELDHRGNVHRGGEGVVGRLAAVHRIVRVDR